MIDSKWDIYVALTQAPGTRTKRDGNNARAGGNGAVLQNAVSGHEMAIAFRDSLRLRIGVHCWLARSRSLP